MNDGQLEIEDEAGFHRRQWHWQRAGWLLMLLLLVAGIVGVFGSGPLSGARQTSADGGLEARYERFLRNGASTRLMLRLAPAAIRGGSAELRVSGTQARAMEVRSVQPQPSAVQAGADGLRYRFEVAPGAHELHLVFDLEVHAIGLQRLEVAPAQGAGLDLIQFAWP